jgi:hypothetical protein
MRTVPEPLYSRVLEIVLAATNASEAGDRPAARGAYRRLRSLFRSRIGSPDPFLTEALADHTGGPKSAARLYRLAIEQSLAFPGEPIYTKQLGLATRLLESGHAGEAGFLLAAALGLATEAGDADALQEHALLSEALVEQASGVAS